MVRSTGVLIERIAVQSAGRSALRRASRSRAMSVVLAPMRSEPSAPACVPRRSATRRSETTVFGTWWRRFMFG